MHELAKVAFVLVFTLWGIYQLWSGSECLQRARASAGWPSVRGKVTAADAAKPPFPGDFHRRPSIVYVYSVEGRSFTGHRIAFGLEDDLYGSPSYASRYLDRYPADSTVSVYYDPTNAEDSVLEPGASFRAYYPTLWGIGMLGAATFGLFAPWH